MPTTLERPRTTTKPSSSAETQRPANRRPARQKPSLPTRPTRPVRMPETPRHAISLDKSTLPKPISTAPSANRRPERPALGRFFADFSLEKSFTVMSFLVAVALAVLCISDLAIAWPWEQASRLFDVTYMACSLVLIWLCYDIFRDQVGGIRSSPNF